MGGGGEEAMVIFQRERFCKHEGAMDFWQMPQEHGQLMALRKGRRKEKEGKKETKAARFARGPVEWCLLGRVSEVEQSMM
jgi:hypothetical protein